MTITIHNTTKIVSLNGIQCRIWEGETERGVAIHCFIPRISVELGLDDTQFQQELEEQVAPSAEVAVIPLRMLI